MLNKITDIGYCLISSFLIITLIPVDGASQNLSFLSDTTHYLWPTDASPYISSTFGETRSSHFHAGLDIRTWGREGYKVLATRDGIVHKLTISPHGYGKAIFLKHDDNSYSIYAHLNRFEDSLMAIADSIRMQDFSFLMENDFDNTEIKVEQGDVIGYTGSTGVGPPHLHFELRTPENEPFNPLLTNIGVEDNLPPIFSAIAVERLNPESYHVENLETKRPDQTGNSYNFGTITTNGPIGLSVNVYDRANRTPNIYAVYGLTLVHEQDTLFHSVVDTFNYRDASQMFIDRVYPLLRDKRQGFQRLFVMNGNHLPFYQTNGTRGVVDLPEGEHELTIIAKDYYGNRSIAVLRLNVTERASPPAANITAIPAYPRKNTHSTSDSQKAELRLYSRSFDAPLLTEMASGGPNSDYTTLSSPISYTKESTVQRAGKKLVPDKRQFLHLPDQTIWIEFPEDALFDTLHVEMTVSQRDKLPVIRFSPENIPLKKKAVLNIVLSNSDEDNLPVGVFSYNQHRNSHTFRGAGMPGSIVRAKISDLREIHLLQDRIASYTGPPRVARNLGGMKVIYVPVVDERSGIDYHRSRIEVNGEKGIVEYDPDHNRLIFYKPGLELRKQNKVEVWAYDGFGNLTHRVYDSVR